MRGPSVGDELIRACDEARLPWRGRCGGQVGGDASHLQTAITDSRKHSVVDKIHAAIGTPEAWARITTDASSASRAPVTGGTSTVAEEC